MDPFDNEPELLEALARWKKVVEPATAPAWQEPPTRPDLRAEDSTLTHPALPAVEGYELLERLGRGGMGVVYKARQVEPNRVVALKMLRADYPADSPELLRFLTEVEAAAALQHPNIVRVYEVRLKDGRPYYTMELAPGGNLAGKIAGKPQPPREAARAVETLARAVHVAHRHGIVHRDIKPSNVLLAEDGAPKIADFGLAKRLASAVDLTQTGAALGTPSYMPPEQIRSRTGSVGPTADVYALGATLYELLTGRPPFQGETQLDTMHLVQTEDPVPPGRLQPKVPRDLETICLVCLAKDPRRRYPTAEDLAAELRRFLDNEPIHRRRPGAVERAGKWARRHPGRAAALAAGLLAAVGAVVGWNEIQKQRGRDRVAAETKTRESRAGSLVQAVAAAETGEVPWILESFADVREPARPGLAELAAEPIDTKRGLHGRFAVFEGDPGLAAELARYLLTCRAEELLTIRKVLGPHAAAVGPDLWRVLTDDAADRGKRVRAACALAGFEPADPRWAAVAPAVADGVVRSSPVEVVVWAEALEPAPVRAALLPHLFAGYPKSRQRIEAGKSEVGSGHLDVTDLAAEVTQFDQTAGLLARYAADRPAELAELALIVDGRHHALLARAVERNRAEVIPVLEAELRKPAADGAGPAAGAIDPESPHNTAARRRANAAAVLLELGDGAPAWDLLRHPADTGVASFRDPTARSLLVARLAGMGADPMTLIRRFGAETDVSAQRAVLLALGDFPPAAVPVRDREELTARLLELYEQHPDPGLHSAIDWLLRRRWGQGKALEAIDEKLAAEAREPGRAPPDRDWFVNRQGLTFARVRGPVGFQMGCLPGEPSPNKHNEVRREMWIRRSFAISTREVTNAQLDVHMTRRSRWAQFSRTPDTPALGVSLYAAARYCNWLSEQEGIPEGEWCYEPVRVEWPWVRMSLYTAGMRVKPGYLSLAGYRLPTEAEWEYACRAGSGVAWSFGRSVDLLPRYSWTLKNSGLHTHPTGSLRPNDLGLFDTHGNAHEWTGSPALRYPDPPNQDVEEGGLAVLDNRVGGILRGGADDGVPSWTRCSFVRTAPRGEDGAKFGFRPVRTLAVHE